MLIEVNESELQDLINNEPKPILIDFYAAWCAPCRAVSPLLAALAQATGDKLVIAKLNVDDNPQMSQKFNIRSIPTLVLLQNGSVLKAHVGGITAASLQKLVSVVV